MFSTLPLKAIACALMIVCSILMSINYYYMLQTMNERDSLCVKYAPESKASASLLDEHYKKHHIFFEKENNCFSTLKP